MSRMKNSSLHVRVNYWKSFVHGLRRRLPSVRGSIERGFSWRKKILDPQGPFLQKWNYILTISCMFAILGDTLFFYIPVVDGKKECLRLDNRLTIVAFVLRSLTDTFYVLHILFRFRTGFHDPAAVYGRGHLIVDSYAIAKRYLSSYFIIDVLSVLPIPQVATLVILPNRKGPIPPITKDWLTYVLCLQLWPRLLRTYSIYKEMQKTSGIFVDETAWGGAVGAALNLILYLLACHGIGAFWYFFAIGRKGSCLRAACERLKCAFDFSYCGEQHEGNYTSLNHFCPLLESNEIKNATDFYFGIFLNALRSRVVETRNVPKKILYCFWWGLRSVSSFGQNLETSTYEWEIVFALYISTVGLVLFAFLIGNMHNYLQSTTMQHLPKAIRTDIKRRRYLALLKRVPMFDKMDEWLLDEVYERLKPVLCRAHRYVVREGHPVDKMIFFLKDDVLTLTTLGGRTADYPHVFDSDYPNGGPFFCGGELLRWAFEVPNSSLSSLPTSTRTVQIVTDNEAFSLSANDLQDVASQYWLSHATQHNVPVN